MVLLFTRLFLVFSLCLSLGAGVANAQSNGQMVDGFITPSFPAPNQSFVMTLESSSADLNRALITWRKDGKLLAQGVGLKNYTALAGKAGVETRFSASAETKEVGRLDKSFVIRPAGLELFWQANTYTPSFYRGKALPSPDSDLILLATTEFVNSQGGHISPSNIVFTWKRNDRVLESQSGTGKNTFLFRTSPLEEDMPIISVEAKSVDGNFSASAEASIPTMTPKVVFYASNDLMGTLMNRALAQTFSMESTEVGLVASPYFIDSSLRNTDSLSYKWSLNGSLIPDNPKSYISLRKPEGSGSSILSLYVEKVGSLFNNATGSLNLHYGQ